MQEKNKKQIQKEIWHDDICELGSATSQTNQPSCNIKLHLKLCKMSMSWKGGLLKEILRKLRLVHNEKRWTSDEIMTANKIQGFKIPACWVASENKLGL